MQIERKNENPSGDLKLEMNELEKLEILTEDVVVLASVSVNCGGFLTIYCC